MNNFIMLIGLPASGKSTYARSKASDNVIVLSSDEIREQLSNGEYNKKINRQVFSTMNNLTIKYLNENKDVIYDATNLNNKDRKGILNRIKLETHNIHSKAVFFDVDFDTCLKRNDVRTENKVPYQYMLFYRNKIQKPTKDEGFDEIEFIVG